MCGILAILRRYTIDPEALAELLLLIDQRGPDYQSPLIEVNETYGEGQELNIKSSVLHLRGDEIQEQPVIDGDGNILMFNGHIYEYSNEPLDKHLSDTTFLSGKLRSCHNKQELADTFASINGPYAFVYWSSKLKILLYGRDIFGRRSLCSLLDQDCLPVILSSVAPPNLSTPGLEWTEVDCRYIHCIDMSDPKRAKTFLFDRNLDHVYPRTSKCNPTQDLISGSVLKATSLKPLNLETRLPTDFTDSERENSVIELERKLIKAVEVRLKYNVTTCLDCRNSKAASFGCNHSQVAVAFSGGIDSTLLAIALDKVLDQNRTIDLITVAFKSKSPDRSSVGAAFVEIRKLCPKRNWRLVLCDKSVKELQNERRKVISNLISPCKTVLDDSLGCACWFVGQGWGRALDSRVHDFWLEENLDDFLQYEPIFVDDTNCPFIREYYKSPASMLFVGSSIDEQLGGYSSHRASWKERSSAGVLDEVSFLMRRLPTRNLGRDDRVYSHHGRDVKLPYLDDDLVSYLNELPVGLKFNLDEPMGLGPKKLLRELALRWGLQQTAHRVKRALQFGTRIANLENPGEKGNDICMRLTSHEINT